MTHLPISYFGIKCLPPEISTLYPSILPSIYPSVSIEIGACSRRSSGSIAAPNGMVPMHPFAPDTVSVRVFT